MQRGKGTCGVKYNWFILRNQDGQSLPEKWVETRSQLGDCKVQKEMYTAGKKRLEFVAAAIIEERTYAALASFSRRTELVALVPWSLVAQLQESHLQWSRSPRRLHWCCCKTIRLSILKDSQAAWDRSDDLWPSI